jgi:omega-amidase
MDPNFQSIEKNDTKTNINNFNLALIQMKVISNKQKNLERAKELTTSAVKNYNAQVVVLPEFFNTPLGLKLEEFKTFVEKVEDSETLKFLGQLAKELDIYIIGGSIPVYYGDDKEKIYNTTFCFNRKGIKITEFDKLHLFDVNIPGKISYQESKRITPGNRYGIFETEYAKFGLGICYDIRFIEYSLLLRKEFNCDILVFPAAFSLKTGEMHWELMGRSRAYDANCFVVLCSQARNYEDSNAYQSWGNSMICDPYGSILNQTGYEEGIIVSKIDIGINNEIKEQIPVWNQKRYGELYDLNISKKN